MGWLGKDDGLGTGDDLVAVLEHPAIHARHVTATPDMILCMMRLLNRPAAATQEKQR
jgi:hypothetical protein